MLVCAVYKFHPLSCVVWSSIIRKWIKTTCMLDPFPTKLLMSHLSSITKFILRFVNRCFSSGVFQHFISQLQFASKKRCSTIQCVSMTALFIF